ncbi:MAG: RidA family protein [Oscillospiraceae bacterium]|nr:RidA family protein [Oscillospiraceae bacterium]
MSDAYENLKRLGLELPPLTEQKRLFDNVRQIGNVLYVSGQGPLIKDEVKYTGKLGADVSMEAGQEAARLVALNVLSSLHDYLGDLNKVKNMVKLLVFVSSASGFHRQPEVANAASQLFLDVFGKAGAHARSAIGVYELPSNIPVEIEAVVEIFP